MTPVPSPDWDAAERVCPEPHNTLYLEHLSAYELAARLVPGGVVVDVGCGHGYGAAHLARGGRKVLGVDLARDVLVTAARRYVHPSLAYACADARHLGVSSGSVDLLTAFQVVEHLADAEGFIREVARVLRPSGVALLATPNALTHVGSPNPYHHREFSPDDLKGLLARHFAHVRLAGQRRPAEIYELEAGCQTVRRWDVLGLRRRLPRTLVGPIVWAIARWKGVTPPQRLPLTAFPLSTRTDDAYNLFALCGHSPLPPGWLGEAASP
jgi:ubiquinone/menaquinone biosynthesis C-methylase UbiE